MNGTRYRLALTGSMLLVAIVIVAVIIGLQTSDDDNETETGTREANLEDHLDLTGPAGYPDGPPIEANSEWVPVSQVVDGVEMVLVPKGCFMMGSDEPLERAAPIHRQCFERPFWIDRTEVTNAQFGSAGIWTDPIYPRDSVTWLEALNHCQARGARLPTEAEWEYAARGPDNLIYPWGNDMVVANSINTESNGEPAPVGSIPQGASWVGAYDMSGNLAEWVSSRFDPYPHNAFDGRESVQDVDHDTELDEDHTEEVFRVQRGGSFAEADLRFQRATSRFGEAADHTFASIGFRCARDFVDG